MIKCCAIKILYITVSKYFIMFILFKRKQTKIWQYLNLEKKKKGFYGEGSPE